MKPAACKHHWIALGETIRHMSSDASKELQAIDVTLGCILCFKYTYAKFTWLGRRIDANTRRMGS